MKTPRLPTGSAATDKSFEFTADFLAAILTWGGIGWVADRFLGTEPLLMVLGFIVGNASGLYLLYIRAREGDEKPGARSPDTTARTTDADQP